MCLFTDLSKMPMPAPEDIICYKVVKSDSWCHPMMSPYHMDFEWEYDKEYTTDGEKKSEPYYDQYHQGYFIANGYFHTFKYESDAWELWDKITWNGRKDLYQVVICKIPKGALIYEGHFGDPQQSHDDVMSGAYCYASNKLTITDVVQWYH